MTTKLQWTICPQIKSPCFQGYDKHYRDHDHDPDHDPDPNRDRDHDPDPGPDRDRDIDPDPDPDPDPDRDRGRLNPSRNIAAIIVVPLLIKSPCFQGYD